MDRLSRVTFINKSFRRSSTNVVSTDGSVSPNDPTPVRNRLSSALGNHSPGEGIVGSIIIHSWLIFYLSISNKLGCSKSRDGQYSSHKISTRAIVHGDWPLRN